MQINRPPAMKKEGIQTRKRKPRSGASTSTKNGKPKPLSSSYSYLKDKQYQQLTQQQQQEQEAAAAASMVAAQATEYELRKNICSFFQIFCINHNYYSRKCQKPTTLKNRGHRATAT